MKVSQTKYSSGRRGRLAILTSKLCGPNKGTTSKGNKTDAKQETKKGDEKGYQKEHQGYEKVLPKGRETNDIV